MLVSVDDLRGYMGGLDLTQGQEIAMASIISGVQQSLETYLNRPVEPVQIREVAYSNFQGVLYLSVTPVWKVISAGAYVGGNIIANPVIPDPMERDLEFIQEDDRVVDLAPKVFNNYAIVPGGIQVGPYRKMLVEYIGGYNGYQEEAIKLGIKRVAAREWATNHVDTTGLRVGQSEQTEVGDSRFLGWASDELAGLSRFRRRVVIR